MGLRSGEVCLGCVHFSQARGLCQNCYRKAREAVKAGKTTWEQLEKEGKCRPLLKKHPNPNWGYCG